MRILHATTADHAVPLSEHGVEQARETGRALAAHYAKVLACEQQFALFDGVPEAELPARLPAELGYYDMVCKFGGKFWARMPLGESRFDVAKRIHQAFGTFHRDALEHGIRVWCHLSPEWFEAATDPPSCAIRMIDGGGDQGYPFEGFKR